MGQEGGTEPLNESLISTLGQAADQHKDALKYSSLLVFLLSTTADTVLARKVSYAAFFPASLAVLTAIAGSVIFPAIVLGQCVISWRRTGESPWKNVFPAYGMRTCEKPYKDILKVILTAPLIGFLFGAHHLLTNTGAGHGPSALPGTLILVLGKLTVPISMLLNMRLLFGGKIYNWRHSCALGFLFIGIICTVWSPLMGASYNIQMAKKYGFGCPWRSTFGNCLCDNREVLEGRAQGSFYTSIVDVDMSFSIAPYSLSCIHSKEFRGSAASSCTFGRFGPGWHDVLCLGKSSPECTRFD